MTESAEIRSVDHPRVSLVVVGGTGESYPGDRRTEVTGLLRAVTVHLDERFDCRWVGYPASYGPAPRIDGMSYRESLDIGVDAVRNALSQTAGPVALIGYSQGAVVIRTALHELHAVGDPVVDRVLAAGFVADPHQPPGAVPGCTGWGVAGPGCALPPEVATCWVGAPEDMICNATADSFIRDVADLTAALALGRLRDWCAQLWNMLRNNRFQNAHRTSPGPAQMWRDFRRLSTAVREVVGYLPDRLTWGGVVVRNRRGGRHTSYSREPYRRTSATDPDTTGCEALARWLQVRATFSPIGCSVLATDAGIAA